MRAKFGGEVGGQDFQHLKAENPGDKKEKLLLSPQIYTGGGRQKELKRKTEFKCHK